MLRLLIFILLIFSFSASAGKYYFSGSVNWGGVHMVTGGEICGSSMSDCANSVPASFTRNGSLYEFCGYSPISSSTFKANYFEEKYSHLGCNDKYSVSINKQFNDEFGCSSNDECIYQAREECEALGEQLKNFQYISPDNYTKECGVPSDPEKDCEENIVAQCVNKLGSASSSYSDDGQGNFTCSGMCNDGTAAEPKQDCNLSNNYCDVADTPSGLDFGSGNTGSDGGSSSDTTTDKDPENDVDYEPDGSGSSASENGGMSSLQGDKLINEVVKSRNDNTDNLASTTDTTNQTIVEKSDDIQNTISNSANGIIDAVNNATPFYDGNIVDAINGIGGDSFDDSGIIDAVNGLGTGIEGLSDKIDGLGDSLGGDFVTDIQAANFSAYDTIFINEDDLEGLTNGYKQSINAENVDFYNQVQSKFSFSAGNTGSYQANNLDLGKWGSHDVSMARFTDYFGGVGNVIYFLAALTALTIVLAGVKL